MIAIVIIGASWLLATIAGTVFMGRVCGLTEPPVPGNAAVPPAAAPAYPGQPPAPGHWHPRPCGCAIHCSPPDILTCPGHAARRKDILDLLLWADELKDPL